jgi:hypothetical protein
MKEFQRFFPIKGLKADGKEAGKLGGLKAGRQKFKVKGQR